MRIYTFQVEIPCEDDAAATALQRPILDKLRHGGLPVDSVTWTLEWEEGGLACDVETPAGAKCLLERGHEGLHETINGRWGVML